MFPLNDWFHNCLSVEKTPAGWVPCRFTPRQLDYYQSLSVWAGIRSRCCTGITMDFTTDARELSFSFQTGDFCRNWLAFDLFEEDRLLYSAVYPEGVPSGRVVFRRDHGGRARFSLHLPYQCQITLNDFSFGDASPILPSRKGVLWCIGDSITQGMEAVHPSQTYAALLGETLQMNVFNQAVGGIGFKDLCLDFSGVPKADAVLVALGTNDCPCALEDWEQYAGRVKESIRLIRDAADAAPVTLISPFWRGDLEERGFQDTLPHIRALLEEEAGRAGFHFIDGLKVLPHDPSFCGDGRLHPNDLGFSICARVLAGQMGI